MRVKKRFASKRFSVVKRKADHVKGWNRLYPFICRDMKDFQTRGRIGTPWFCCVLILAWLLAGTASPGRAAGIEEGTVTAVYGSTKPTVVTFPGDVIAVEVRDFDGWLNLQLKKGFFNNDPFVKNIWLADSTVNGPDGTTKLKNYELMEQDRWAQASLKARGAYNLFLREQLSDLRLVIDDERLPSILPDKIDRLERPDYTLHELLFHLTRDDDNRAEWQPLLSNFKFQRAVKLTLGTKITDGPWLYLPSLVEPMPKGKISPLELKMVSTWNFTWAVLLILVGFAVFCSLVGPTDLLRDSGSTPRPGGLGRTCHSYSLARCQMAFWFFLVAAAYLFIWLTTGRLDGINEQVLGLIGISAGTALGVAFISSGGGPSRTMEEEAARSSDPALTAGERECARNRWQRLSEQQDRLTKSSAFGRVMDDLLAEDGAVTFHRFQLMAWTAVLGLVFVCHFLANYSLPEFSGTTLALMGISSGTYLGFKIPGQG